MCKKGIREKAVSLIPFFNSRSQFQADITVLYNALHCDKQTEKFIETTSAWDENQKKWVYKKEALPLEVNGYKLYHGDIKTNEVSISFD